MRFWFFQRESPATRRRVAGLSDSALWEAAASDAHRKAEFLAREARATEARARVAARLAYDLAYSGGRSPGLDEADDPTF